MTETPKVVAIIPARAGSTRVADKNIRLLNGHPLIAYTIVGALQSEVFDAVVVSTDSERYADIARYYGAEVPFLRPQSLATSVSPDIEFLKHAFSHFGDRYPAFSILRPTSPFRKPGTIQRAWREFLSLPDIDSIRAVELCHEHPGKMWIVEGNRMHPLLDQSHLEFPWYAGQYQALPKVYIQNSSLEIAWSRVVVEQGSREGKVLAPFLTDGAEGFSIDYEDDWTLVLHMIGRDPNVLPLITQEPYPDLF